MISILFSSSPMDFVIHNIIYHWKRISNSHLPQPWREARQKRLIVCRILWYFFLISVTHLGVSLVNAAISTVTQSKIWRVVHVPPCYTCILKYNICLIKLFRTFLFPSHTFILYTLFTIQQRDWLLLLTPFTLTVLSPRTQQCGKRTPRS